MGRGGGALFVGALIALLFATAPDSVAAQAECRFGSQGNDQLDQVPLPDGSLIVYIRRPHLLCPDGVQIWGDSAIAYQAQNLFHIIGNFRFRDANSLLTAKEARYFSDAGRLQATGDVFVQDTVQGFTIQDGDLVYLRVTDFRDQAQIDVRTGPDQVQPRAEMRLKPAPPDSASMVPDSTVLGHLLIVDDPAAAAALAPPMPPDTTSTPFVVYGHHIRIEGDSYFSAAGEVVIDRDSLLAYGDSAEYAQGLGEIVLSGNARVDGARYDLAGRTIRMKMVGNDINGVHAAGNGVLTGEDLRLTAPDIRLFLVDGGLDRLVAVGERRAVTPRVGPPQSPEAADAPVRPIATAADFEMTADSLDILAPDESLQQVFAAGAARTVSHAGDSLNVDALPDVARTDWLEGETIVVSFLPKDSAPADPSAGDQSAARVDRITARVGARSLYRLPPSDTTARAGRDAPALHYVVGDTITIIMDGSEVERMNIQGQTRGVHLEPLRALALDSLAADSIAIDTAAARARLDTTEAHRRPDPGLSGLRPSAAAYDPSRVPGTPAQPPAEPITTTEPRRRS